jgi:hypothetical protein
MGHTRGRLCKGVTGQGKETKNLNEVDVSLYRNEYRHSKLSGATMGSRLGRSEEDWKRRVGWGCNPHVHGNNTRKCLV